MSFRSARIPAREKSKAETAAGNGNFFIASAGFLKNKKYRFFKLEPVKQECTVVRFLTSRQTTIGRSE